MSDRNNYASMADLQEGCDEARRILKRKRSSIEEVRRAALLLNKGIRSLRSWYDTARQSVSYARSAQRKLREQLEAMKPHRAFDKEAR